MRAKMRGRGAGAELPALAGLIDRHRTFVTVYLKEGNASEAARQAGFNWPGQKGAKLLKTAKIRSAIEAEIKRCYPLGKTRILAALSELAHSNLADFLDDQGQPVLEKIRTNGHVVKKYKARVLRSLSTDQVTVTDVRLEVYDQCKALITIGKMLGMFSITGIRDQFAQEMFDALGEALVKFVPIENRVPMVTFLRERLNQR
jgi:hypothetical protein